VVLRFCSAAVANRMNICITNGVKMKIEILRLEGKDSSCE